MGGRQWPPTRSRSPRPQRSRRVRPSRGSARTLTPRSANGHRAISNHRLSDRHGARPHPRNLLGGLLLGIITSAILIPILAGLLILSAITVWGHREWFPTTERQPCRLHPRPNSHLSSDRTRAFSFPDIRAAIAQTSSAGPHDNEVLRVRCRRHRVPFLALQTPRSPTHVFQCWRFPRLIASGFDELVSKADWIGKDRLVASRHLDQAELSEPA